MASEEAVDWRVGLTTLQRFAYMLDGKYSCDVTFLVGQGEKQEAINCHSFPLIAGSAVFEHLLEKKIHQEITVPDVEPSGFKTLIKYLYGGELNIQANNVMAVMHAANKYSIAEVTEKCGDFLTTQIKTDNVCTILETSIQYGETSLTEKCLKFIWSKAAEVLASNDLICMSHEALIKVVESDALRTMSEVILYKACIKWADAECERRQIEVTDDNRREVLGDALFQIRFPTMTHVEFAEISSQSELLTDNECRKIFEHIIQHSEDDTSCQSKLKFNTKRRSLGHVTVSRFSASNIRLNWLTQSTACVVNAVDFESNIACSIEGIGLFGGDTACDRNVSVKLLDSSGSVLSSTSKAIITDGTKTPVRVDFPQPVMISAGKRYSVVASIDGQSRTYYGEKGSVRVDNAGFVVILQNSSHGMYNNQRNATFGDAQCGQIPELHFNA